LSESVSLSFCPAAGRADIQAGQQALSGKLDLLLRRQQAAIDAMNAANRQLAALQVGWLCAQNVTAQLVLMGAPLLRHPFTMDLDPPGVL
jgi:hypothetical protein